MGGRDRLKARLSAIGGFVSMARGDLKSAAIALTWFKDNGAAFLRFLSACARGPGNLGTDRKDDQPEGSPPSQSDLAAAVRRARVENAERAEAITDLREVETARLALLENALKPVVALAQGVDLFDLALAQGDHPRLVIDVIAIIDMAADS